MSFFSFKDYHGYTIFTIKSTFMFFDNNVPQTRRDIFNIQEIFVLIDFYLANIQVAVM